MVLFSLIRHRAWPTLFGYGLFIGMLATGYYYNITFVQLGLVDLGTRLIGMSEPAVALRMALLAVLTCGVALLFGLLMQRRGWSQQLVTKLRLAFVVVCVQTILTGVALFIHSAPLFLVWIVIASAILGIGVPVTFSMTVDLIPTRDRGYVAAGITAAAYGAAAVGAYPWRIEHFSAQLIGVMLLGAVTLGLLAFRRFGMVETLARQHMRPEFGRGRFIRTDARGHPRIRRSLTGLIVLMFTIYFIDSLGFLRLIATPVYVDTAWQSPDLGPRLVIGGTHVLAALIAGVLYAALSERELFAWIFGIFALAQLMYVTDVRLTPLLPGRGAPLSMPMLYAIAVSLYTVVNFAIWADVSTPQTISRNAAVGVALSGWTATFISTALAMYWRAAGVSLDRHLSVVAALALLGLSALLAARFFRGSASTTNMPPEDTSSLPSESGGHG